MFLFNVMGSKFLGKGGLCEVELEMLKFLSAVLFDPVSLFLAERFEHLLCFRE